MMAAAISSGGRGWIEARIRWVVRARLRQWLALMMLMVTLVTAVMKAGKGKGQQQRQAAAAELDSGRDWEGGM